MEVILKQEIKTLGDKNEIVKVKTGYGMNYLIPKGLAVIANKSNKKMAKENAKQAAHKVEKVRQDALELAEKLNSLDIEIGAKAGETGRLFGTITTLQVAKVLKEKGLDVDRKKISFTQEIKELGKHVIKVDLHKEVVCEVSINVVINQ